MTETATIRERRSHLWDRDPHDWYVEPEWCSVRLFEVEDFHGTVWDPACGTGRILEAAVKAGHAEHATDIVQRGYPLSGYRLDFLTSDTRLENIVSNPPFKIAEPFIKHALKLAERKVAMLLPTVWLQGEKRSRWLAQTPLARVWFLCPRPSMPPGRVIEAGGKPGNGTKDFCWLVWDKRARTAHQSPTFGWLYKEARK